MIYRTNAEDLQNNEHECPKLLAMKSPFTLGQHHHLRGEAEAGKTTLLFELAREWGRSGLRVVYFTSDGLPTWRHRLKDTKVTNIVLVPAGPGDAMASLIAPGDDVVIVDVLTTNWAPIIEACLGKTLILIRNQGNSDLVDVHLTCVPGDARSIEGSGARIVYEMKDGNLSWCESKELSQ